MLQRVTTLGGYLNYPSALIRQSRERRGRQAERERSRLELSARSRLTAAGLARASGGGCEEEEGGEGVPLPLLVPSGGVSAGQALQSRALRGGLLLQESGWPRDGFSCP